MASNGGAASEGTATQAMRRMAEAEPELAARLMLQSMPLAAAGLPDGLSYRLELSDLGAWRISPNGGHAEVSEVSPAASSTATPSRSRPTPARSHCSPPAPTRCRRCSAAACGCGASAARRWRCASSSQDAGPRELAKLGLPVDADLLYRALPYAIEPEWTRGHSFRIGYELVGEGGGTWTLVVDDGSVSCERGLDDEPQSLVRIRYEDWLKLLSGEANPTDSARLGLTELHGEIPPVTLVGRWMDRAEGRRRPRARARGAPAPRPSRARRLGLPAHPRRQRRQLRRR